MTTAGPQERPSPSHRCGSFSPQRDGKQRPRARACAAQLPPHLPPSCLPPFPAAGAMATRSRVRQAWHRTCRSAAARRTAPPAHRRCRCHSGLTTAPPPLFPAGGLTSGEKSAVSRGYIPKTAEVRTGAWEGVRVGGGALQASSRSVSPTHTHTPSPAPLLQGDEAKQEAAREYAEQKGVQLDKGLGAS